MKKRKIILIIVPAIFIIFIITAFIRLTIIKHRSLPDYSDNSMYPEGIEVKRDKYGAPYIYGKTDTDVYFTTGYLTAQDRLWQMDLLRRVTHGRLSEIFGEDYVDADLFLRALKFPQKAKKTYQQADPKIKKAMEAYCNGVNAYINKMKKKLPIEFTILGYEPEEWTPIHSYTLVGYMSWNLSCDNYYHELLIYKIAELFDNNRVKDMFPDDWQYLPTIYPDKEITFDESFSLLGGSEKIRQLGLYLKLASNNWAISGSKTDTGKPYLANDMHLGFSFPSIWYQINQKSDEGLNTSGVAIPGEPFIIAGRNNRIAWGETAFYVDDIDLYVEKVDPANPGKYFFDGKWREMLVSTEKIKIKGGKEVIKEILYTHRGPMISKFEHLENIAISMRWVGFEDSDEVNGVYNLNHASNWNDFRNALADFKSINQNFIYADIDGNIGLQATGSIPIREGNGRTIRPGDTSQYDWKGEVEFDKLPSRYNPSSGYLVSANNKTINNYPYYIGSEFAMPYRFKRITGFIEAMTKSKGTVSIADMKKLQVDQYSLKAEELLPHLIPLLNKKYDKYKQLLLNWDRYLHQDSIEAAIFEVFYEQLKRDIVSDEFANAGNDELLDSFLSMANLPEDFIYRVIVNKTSPWIDDVTTTEIEKLDHIVNRAFDNTLSFLKKKLGKNLTKWQWGKIHHITLSHPLGNVKILDFLFNFNVGPVEIGGSFDTVSPFAYHDLNFNAVHGAVQRHIYSLDEQGRIFFVIPGGESGQPGSLYYSDQSELYFKNQYCETYFDLFLKK